jgi:hypothetical protein
MLGREISGSRGEDWGCATHWRSFGSAAICSASGPLLVHGSGISE